MSHPSIKFQESQFSIFCLILLRDKTTNKQNLFGGGNEGRERPGALLLTMWIFSPTLITTESARVGVCV